MRRAAVATRFIPQVALALLFVGVLLWRGIIADLAAAVPAAGWRWVLVAGPLAWLSLEVHGLRWWMLVRRARVVPFRVVMNTLFVSGAAGLLLPLRAGALLQLQVLHGRYGIGRTALAGTLVAEALLDAIVLPLLALPVVLALGWPAAVVWALLLAAGGSAAVALAIPLLGGHGRGRWRRTLPGPFRRRASRLAGDLDRGLAGLSGGRSLLALLLLTAGTWLLSAVAYGVLGVAFGLEVSPLAYLAVEIMANLSGAVALAQGNLGSYELAVSGALMTFGARADEAAVFAVAAHAAIIAGTLGLGLAAAAALRLRRADLWPTHAVVTAQVSGSEPPLVRHLGQALLAASVGRHGPPPRRRAPCHE